MRDVYGGKTDCRRNSLPRLGLPWAFFLIFMVSCQPAKGSVTLALLGDISLGRGVTPSSGSFAFLDEYLGTADLAFANLESPLANIPPSSSPEGAYNLCVLGSPTELLTAWNLDILSIANNHRYDCGPDGFYETASILSIAGFFPVGMDVTPVILEVNKQSLAFFAFDDVSSPVEIDSTAQAIQEAAEEGFLPIVSVHWGAEYQAAPSDRQQELARSFMAAGAVLVWGHHPHVLQPCDGCSPSTLPGRVVLYSLGNALFDQAGLADTHLSALALVTLEESGVNKVEFIPFEIDTRHSRIMAPGVDQAKKVLERLHIP